MSELNRSTSGFERQLEDQKAVIAHELVIRQVWAPSSQNQATIRIRDPHQRIMQIVAPGHLR
jgi:hypothetical protein